LPDIITAMKKLKSKHRERVRPLYEGFPGLHGAIEAVLEGAGGKVYVDDADEPRVSRMVVGDFHMIAGDHTSPKATKALRAVPKREYIAVPDDWHELVHATLPDAEPRERIAMRAPEHWDAEALARMRQSLPEGYTLTQVDKHSVKEFRDLNPTFVDNFKSLKDYLQRGIGFAVSNEEGVIVAGCSTYTISSRCLEFEIETRKDYWRRGLALVTGARMIEHCLEAGLEPCWDAAHEGSAVLAERLGFLRRRSYTGYRLP
jgi:hypothetical protein